MSNDMYHTIVQFGAVKVHETSHETLRVKNTNSAPTNFEIVPKSKPEIDLIRNAFRYHSVPTRVPANHDFVCKISYSPLMVNTRNVDYQEVVDGLGNVYLICVEGECIGPLINLTATVLHFHYHPDSNILTNTVGLENQSEVETLFHFDIKNFKIGNFKVNKCKGVLKPKSTVYVKVSCDQLRSGTFSTQLIALILDHPPLICTLVGLYDLTRVFNYNEVIFKYYDLTNKDGFEEFLGDRQNVKKQKPPLSLTHHNLDFGGFDVDNPNYCTLVTSLTNHMARQVFVDWDIDSDIFSITPHSMILSPHDCVLYECKFIAKDPYCFYEDIVSARVTWFDTRNISDSVYINVPMNVFLRLTGSTFPDEKTWIPQVELFPAEIYVPNAVPMHPSYSTFMIKNKSTLPVRFKLIAPKYTTFIVKPMLGVFVDYQIFVLQLAPDTMEPKMYTEDWYIELDGRSNQLMVLTLNGCSETPLVVVGDNNEVNFEPAYPGCQSIATVPIENLTWHCVFFQFSSEDDRIEFKQEIGALRCKETAVLTWYCRGDLDASEEFNVECKINSYKCFKEKIGNVTVVNVTVKIKCIASYLTAVPNQIDCYALLIRTQKTVSFKLCNDGESAVNFYLKMFEVFNFEEDLPEQVRVDPIIGVAPAKSELPVNIFINALYRGFHKLIISYVVRKTFDSNEIVDGPEFNIFELTFYVEYPTLQVEDIFGITFGTVISKYYLWKMLNIDKLNKALKEINDDQTKWVNMYFPDVVQSDDCHEVVLIVKNVTDFPTEWKLHRKKLCDCKLVEHKVGISKSVKEYDCIHKRMFEMKLSNPAVKARWVEYVTIKITYSSDESTKMRYILILPKNRKIKINCTFSGLPSGFLEPSKYNSNFNFRLKSVFLGEKDPADQAFWLYNNTDNETTYEVYAEAFEELQEKYQFDIMRIVNLKGTIHPKSRVPVLFKFTPIEEVDCKASVPILFGTEYKTLDITGPGGFQYSSHIYETIGGMPMYNRDLNSTMHVPAYLSADHILVEPFLVWSVVERVVFIKNVTKNSTLLYCWDNYCEEGIISASFDKKRGVLNPLEEQAIIITLQSYSETCLVQIILSCGIIDFTQYLVYKESQEAYKQQADTFEDYFTITEKGTEYPKCTVKILPKPEPIFLNVTLSCNISSSIDRDMKINVKEQFKQSPTSVLRCDAELVANKIMQAKCFQGKIVWFFPKDCCGFVEQNLPKVAEEKIGSNVDDYMVLKNTTQAIMWDAVMSQAFAQITKDTQPLMPFYHQIKMISGQTVDADKLGINLNAIEEEYRQKLLVRRLQRPQAAMVADVFKELLADALHEVFQLGPKKKDYEIHKPVELEVIYEAKKKLASKFTCIC